MIRFVKVSFAFNKRPITVVFGYEEVRHLAGDNLAPEKGLDCLAYMAFDQVADQIRGRSDSTLWDLALDIAGVLRTTVMLSYGKSECAPCDQLEVYLREAVNILNGGITGKLFRLHVKTFKDITE
jgi:hypothetical protein